MHAFVSGLDLFHWPRLEEILDDIEEQRHSLPSKLSNDFFNVFSSVLVIVEQICRSGEFYDYISFEHSLLDKPLSAITQLLQGYLT